MKVSLEGVHLKILRRQAIYLKIDTIRDGSVVVVVVVVVSAVIDAQDSTEVFVSQLPQEQQQQPG